MCYSMTYDGYGMSTIIRKRTELMSHVKRLRIFSVLLCFFNSIFIVLRIINKIQLKALNFFN